MSMWIIVCQQTPRIQQCRNRRRNRFRHFGSQYYRYTSPLEYYSDITSASRRLKSHVTRRLAQQLIQDDIKGKTQSSALLDLCEGNRYSLLVSLQKGQKSFHEMTPHQNRHGAMSLCRHQLNLQLYKVESTQHILRSGTP